MRPPVPVTPLFGRQAALDDLLALVSQPRVRLVTLTGAGGTGKSRLALELAAELAPSFDNVWFVDLTTVRDPLLVSSAVAQAIGVQEAGRKDLNEIIADVLAARPTLIILDNFEHVLEGAGFVSYLLQRCPQLVAIATSREALGLRSEHVYFVAPLSVPDLDRLEDPRAIRQSPSVTLFEERARARRASFQLNDDALATVARICIHLDGLPLAIELAAAQAAVLTPPVILKRLEARAPLTGTVHRDLPARHQTLQAAIAWGYELLEPEERRIFRACGVFAGGFSTAAVEHVCGPSPAEQDILGVLVGLVSKSLIRVDEGAAVEPRFWLLETLRDYALQQLVLDDELAGARSRHAAYYVQFAESLQDAVQGPGLASALDKLAAEYANFRAVFQWASDTGALVMGLRLAGPLYRLWLARGPLTEARGWLETALSRSQTQAVPPAIRAVALYAAGGLAGIQLDHDRAMELFRQSLELWEALGDEHQQAAAHLNLGIVAYLTHQGDEAHRELERAHELFVALGDRRGQARAVASRARLAREQGDLDQAMRLAEEALSLNQSSGDAWGTAHGFADLGHVRLALGDRRGALLGFRQALEAWRAVGNIIELAESLDGVAAVVAGSEPRRATLLLGTAEALRERAGATVAAVEQRRYQELLARLRGQLREDTFAAAWREGRGLSADRAVELALRDEAADAQAAGVLSPRELEIAQLIARGQSNNDIAEQLVVSVKTVETHIQHIFRKLDVKRRAEIAAWVVRQNIL